jgi:hypothetical protein
LPTEVHQRWQIDFKLGIELANGQQVNLCTIRDPVGAAVIGAYLFPAGPVGPKPTRVTTEQVRSALRASFAQWGTLPDEVQTDGEVVFIGKPQDTFPSRFTLWLTGLGIDHVVIRPGRPTDNAEVERCHRTVNDYAVVGHESADMEKLQQILVQAVYELNHELSSKAKGCDGRPPVKAYPELLTPRRPFRPEHELSAFDMGAVDDLLASLTWARKVGKYGQITLGKKDTRYLVGRAYARQQVLIRFDPSDRHLVFYDSTDTNKEIVRRPIRGMDLTDLTGLARWPRGLGIQQPMLPCFTLEGVSC